ncbi:MAG: MBL fold metallo-hydrolase [Chitinivibrionales bacterium]
MLIRCWGSRGSVPVCGEQSLRYGGDTTCIEVRAGDQVIIIDAGTGIRPLGERLFKEGVKQIHLLFTHAHWDHIIGFPFFYPLYRSDTHLKIRGYPFNRQAFRSVLDTLMSEPFFPVHFGGPDVRADITFQDISLEPFRIGELNIRPVFLSHPRNGAVGYRFETSNRSFVFLTDNELGYTHPGGLDIDRYAEFSRDADLLIHDAEYTDKEYLRFKGWGHSRISDVAALGYKAGVKSLGLFHINQKRSDSDMDGIVADARHRLKQLGCNASCLAIPTGFEINL